MTAERAVFREAAAIRRRTRILGVASHKFPENREAEFEIQDLRIQRAAGPGDFENHSIYILGSNSSEVTAILSS
jgi:hypothetical protein